ncbi:hypothetical protein AXG93_1783s1010 [Marchantia polymorpha subsp. ruderalis]|uniref:Uncharacterized protein n=1 Tax=Marchantia polymorpha subsp. ruderalis TaxID=1480154 RepID=A0A176VCW6_MARPO|nr:hypothetical protein AXG93_1783s1010 [Marchantia polymorpha subsp. ruderalis]
MVMIEGRIGGTSPAHRDCAYSEGKSSTSCQHERFQIHLAVSRPGGTGIGLQGGRRKCAGADPVPLGGGAGHNAQPSSAHHELRLCHGLGKLAGYWTSRGMPLAWAWSAAGQARAEERVKQRWGGGFSL